MADVIRFSVSLENALLEAFDRYLADRGYPTRSEAIRDLIRDQLIRNDTEAAEGEQVVVVSLVFDHHNRNLTSSLLEKQHCRHELVVAVLHVHLGERHCLEVIVLRGPSAAIRQLGDELVAAEGVLHGQVMTTGSEADFGRWH